MNTSFCYGRIAVIPLKSSTRNALKDGDYIDPEELVTVSIVPASGYCIEGEPTGTFTKNKIRYSTYLKEVENYINKHPIQKQIRVTLPDEDAYGRFVFEKADNTVVNGDVLLNDREKLTVTYEITNTNYQLKTFIIGDKKKRTVTKTITAEQDGSVLGREFFDIQVIEKGN